MSEMMLESPVSDAERAEIRREYAGDLTVAFLGDGTIKRIDDPSDRAEVIEANLEFAH